MNWIYLKNDFFKKWRKKYIILSFEKKKIQFSALNFFFEVSRRKLPNIKKKNEFDMLIFSEKFSGYFEFALKFFKKQKNRLEFFSLPIGKGKIIFSLFGHRIQNDVYFFPEIRNLFNFLDDKLELKNLSLDKICSFSKSDIFSQNFHFKKLNYFHQYFFKKLNNIKKKNDFINGFFPNFFFFHQKNKIKYQKNNRFEFFFNTLFFFEIYSFFFNISRVLIYRINFGPEVRFLKKNYF
jgi:hypothetical protein